MGKIWKKVILFQFGHTKKIAFFWIKTSIQEK